MTRPIEILAASAPDVSASQREIVETVRVHILPSDPITFETLTGEDLTVGGPDLVESYFQSCEAYRLDRGQTYIPVEIEHKGISVGMLARFELEEDGIFAVLDLWKEGNEAREGRDFVSAFWEFSDFGADDRPRSTRTQEISFTNKPQFALAQDPIVRLEDSIYTHVAATLSPAAYVQTQSDGEMTPEEMATALLEMDDFKAAMIECVTEAINATATEEEEEAEEIAEEIAEEVAAADGEEVEVEAEEESAVAASLAEINAKLARVEKAQKVAASLVGQISNPFQGSAPKAGVDYINAQLEKGSTLTEAMNQNRNLKGS